MATVIYSLVCLSISKKPENPCHHSELRRLGALELKLELVRNQGDELTIGGLSFGVGYRVAEEALQGIQIASVPGDLDGVSDCPLYPGWGGAECFRHLGVEDLGDGVACLTARWGLPREKIYCVVYEP